MTTREEIVHLLRTKGGLSAKEIARDLSITSVGVRRHLATLERDGMVKGSLVRQKMGRPTLVFSLTDHARDDFFPNNYHTLATQLLDAVHQQKGERGVSDLFRGRMDQLLAQYRPRMQGKNLQDRVKELAKIQEEAGYMATWEPTQDGFLLKEQNCAIYRVACRFQQACQFEIDLFRELLDADINRVQHQMRGESCCAYLIRDRKAATSSKPASRTNASRQ